jgi:hypothetical protein
LPEARRDEPRDGRLPAAWDAAEDQQATLRIRVRQNPADDIKPSDALKTL